MVWSPGAIAVGCLTFDKVIDFQSQHFKRGIGKYPGVKHRLNILVYMAIKDERFSADLNLQGFLTKRL